MAASRTIFVAGAGIGGLTASLALAARGFRVVVLEKAERLEEAGAGLQLSPNASRVLVELGLQPRLAHRAVTPDAISLMSARSGSVTGLGKTRVEALTDGIFGAVMTVLGLSLTIPYITGPAQQDLPALEDVVTGVLTYALSFVTLGVFWVGHHVGFQVVKRTDRTFIWLNNVFLLFVGLLSTEWFLRRRWGMV